MKELFSNYGGYILNATMSLLFVLGLIFIILKKYKIAFIFFGILFGITGILFIIVFIVAFLFGLSILFW